MKKDFRFLKSLALTGMLATSILGTVVYADTENKDVKTEPIGIFNKLVTDTKNVVPFILTNREDYISKKDIEESTEFQNKTISFDRDVQDDTILHTGDTFKVDGTTHTILIYGDVNQDGYIDVFDALTIQENVFEGNLSNTQKVAANVIIADDSDMDVFDALAIQQYSGEFRDTIPDKIPEKEQTPTPTPPPTETNKIVDFIAVDLTAGLDTYHRYDSKVVIGTVKSSNDAKLESKYIKYKVKKDGVDVSNILTYKESTTEEGTFNIEFYATEKGTYTITPCVQGKDGLIEKTANNITISVEENLEVTDIEIVGITNNKTTLSEGKTKEFAIKLYHEYTSTVKPDITDQVVITNISREKTGSNSQVSFRQNDADKTLINVDANGKLTGDSSVHLGYMELTGVTEGTGDSITIKVDNKEITLNIDVRKAEIVGITTDGKNITTPINANLYTSIAGLDECGNDIDASGVGRIYKDGNYYINEYNSKLYTIIPLQLVDDDIKDNITKIQYNTQLNVNITPKSLAANQVGKISLAVDNTKGILPPHLATIMAYTINEVNGKLVYTKSSGTEKIDAIGIALQIAPSSITEAWKNNAKNGAITIEYGGSTISVPVNITVKPENP